MRPEAFTVFSFVIVTQAHTTGSLAAICGKNNTASEREDRLELQCSDLPKYFSSKTAGLLVTARALWYLCVLGKNWALWPLVWPGEDVVRLALLWCLQESPLHKEVILQLPSYSFMCHYKCSTDQIIFGCTRCGKVAETHRLRPMFDLFLPAHK